MASVVEEYISDVPPDEGLHADAVGVAVVGLPVVNVIGDCERHRVEGETLPHVDEGGVVVELAFRGGPEDDHCVIIKLFKMLFEVCDGDQGRFLSVDSGDRYG
nr:MAG TPA: hypothetical protein [Caudoviricetes sp.]